MKKAIIGLMVAAASTFSMGVYSANDSVTDISYYSDSSMQQQVGYWYQSCYLGFSEFWGTRTSHRQYGQLHGKDCTDLTPDPKGWPGGL